jgi:hypothetical protein
MSVEVKIDEREFANINRILQDLDKRVRKEAVTVGLQNASAIVVNEAKAHVPKPGYPFDKPGKKPLRDTIGFEVRDYPSGTFVAVIGAQYPAGAHAHLVESGHEIWLPSPPYKVGADTVATGKRTKPVPFMERAADNTQSRQIAAITSTLKQFANSVR